MPDPVVVEDKPEIADAPEDLEDLEDGLFDVAEDYAGDPASVEDRIDDESVEIEEPDIAVIGLDDPDPVTFIPASEGRPDVPGPEGFEDEPASD